MTLEPAMPLMKSRPRRALWAIENPPAIIEIGSVVFSYSIPALPNCTEPFQPPGLGSSKLVDINVEEISGQWGQFDLHILRFD